MTHLELPDLLQMSVNNIFVYSCPTVKGMLRGTIPGNCFDVQNPFLFNVWKEAKHEDRSTNTTVDLAGLSIGKQLADLLSFSSYILTCDTGRGIPLIGTATFSCRERRSGQTALETP